MLLHRPSALLPPVLQVPVEIEVAHDVDDVHGGEHDDPHWHHAQQGTGVLGERVKTRLVQNQLQAVRPSFTFLMK